MAEAISQELRVSAQPNAIEQALGIQVFLLQIGKPQPPRLVRQRDGEQWMVSRRWLATKGESPLLEVRQNVTAQLRQDRIVQLLLVAAAGASMLFTSVLLRLVLRRGLVFCCAPSL